MIEKLRILESSVAMLVARLAGGTLVAKGLRQTCSIGRLARMKKLPLILAAVLAKPAAFAQSAGPARMRVRLA